MAGLRAHWRGVGRVGVRRQQPLGILTIARRVDLLDQRGQPRHLSAALGVFEQKLHALVARLPGDKLLVNRSKVIERQGRELVFSEGRADQVTQRSGVVTCGHRIAPSLRDQRRELPT